MVCRAEECLSCNSTLTEMSISEKYWLSLLRRLALTGGGQRFESKICRPLRWLTVIHCIPAQCHISARSLRGCHGSTATTALLYAPRGRQGLEDGWMWPANGAKKIVPCGWSQIISLACSRSLKVIFGTRRWFTVAISGTLASEFLPLLILCYILLFPFKMALI